MRKAILCLLLCSLQALSVTAGQISGNITVNGSKRQYIGYLPNNMGNYRPLLISCHGMNQDAAYQKNMLSIESVADTAKFLTIFPEGIDKSWDISGDRDIKFVLAIIDEMEKKYKIDRNFVYLSGFSMGGMFTYHAMNKIADKIAAFAPISGYPMWGTTADAKVRPIPIIHTHGTSDDVVGFSGVQGALNVWIRHNGCPTTAKVEKRYRNAAHITRHTWGPGKNGVEVVLMEMADKGHWISNDNGVKTGDEIWRFCKRYCLVDKNPKVNFTSPQSNLTFVTFGGTSDAASVTLDVEATDPDGQVVSVAYYDGSTLLAEFDKAPYTYQLTGLKKGTHKISAVVTDDEGRTGSNEISIKLLEPTSSSYYPMAQDFKTVENGVPDGWSTYDGQEKRTGVATGFSSGSRVFHFTNSRRAFEWGLYTRNVTGAPKAGYARFGDEGCTSTLTFYPGRYQLAYKVCNWNQPNFSPVTIAVETLDGQEVCSEVFTPEVNVGNAADKAFATIYNQYFVFDIQEKGRYVITFYTADAPWADLVIGQSNLYYKGANTGITEVQTADEDTPCYNLSGMPVAEPKAGIYIKGGKKVIFK